MKQQSPCMIQRDSASWFKGTGDGAPSAARPDCAQKLTAKEPTQPMSPKRGLWLKMKRKPGEVPDLLLLLRLGGVC